MAPIRDGYGNRTQIQATLRCDVMHDIESLMMLITILGSNLARRQEKKHSINQPLFVRVYIIVKVYLRSRSAPHFPNTN
jgi:hypothetical protein